jgi:hypothetical protein
MSTKNKKLGGVGEKYNVSIHMSISGNGYFIYKYRQSKVTNRAYGFLFVSHAGISPYTFIPLLKASFKYIFLHLVN